MHVIAMFASITGARILSKVLVADVHHDAMLALEELKPNLMIDDDNRN